MIDLVSAWEEVEEPSVQARQAQVRAYATLGLVDLAWRRVEPNLAADSPDPTWLALLPDVFPGRTWPTNARKALERAMGHAPDDTGLRDLWDHATEAPTDADPGHVADDQDDNECANAAARLLATGLSHRARVLIERVRKRSPDHAFAADVAWAIEGDHTPREVDLANVAETWRTEFVAPASSNDEPEHTESGQGGRAPWWLDEADPTSGSFPPLFLGQTRPARARDEGEQTEEVHLSRQVLDPDAAAPELTGAGDETQVRRVVTRDGALPVRVTEVGHDPYDLAALRDEVHDAVDEDAHDDDDVVVLRRYVPETEPEHTDGRGLALEATDAGAPPLSTESTAWVRPQAAPTVPPARAVQHARQPPPRWPWIVAFLAVWTLALLIVTAVSIAHLLRSHL